MQRRSSVFFLLAVLAAATGARAQAQEAGPKIGYINSQAILEQAPGAREAQEELNEDMQGYRAQVQQMADELEALIRAYEQQQLTLSAEAKARREQEIRQKQQEYQAKLEQLDQQASARQAELVQPIMDRINQVIESIRSDGDYALIFDVAAGSIIAADPGLDLTEEVIRRLQAGGSATPGIGGGG